MDKGDNHLKTLINNLDPKKKLGLIIGFITFIILIILIVNLSQNSFNSDTKKGPIEETYTDEQGYTVNREIVTDENGETSVQGTKEDQYGNVTTLDPDLITTYFPYQVMREHLHHTPTLKYYLGINEDTGVIRVNMEDCDVENDKKEIEEYLDSIPLDLSNYTIEYELSNTDTNCGI